MPLPYRKNVNLVFQSNVLRRTDLNGSKKRLKKLHNEHHSLHLMLNVVRICKLRSEICVSCNRHGRNEKFL
jgi:hypothetical protein